MYFSGLSGLAIALWRIEQGCITLRFVCAHIRGMIVTNYSSDIEFSSAEHAYTVNYTLLSDLMVNFR